MYRFKIETIYGVTIEGFAINLPLDVILKKRWWKNKVVEIDIYTKVSDQKYQYHSTVCLRNKHIDVFEYAKVNCKSPSIEFSQSLKNNGDV